MSMADFAKATTAKHKSVLLQESIDGLNLKAGQVFIDGTLGTGGHSAEVLRRFPQMQIIGLDRDRTAIDRTREKLGIEAIQESFANIDKVCEELKVRPDAILYDLGISSDQLETSGRGFTFQKDEPLDMRMSGPLDQSSSAQTITAADILNSWDEQAIELILRGFGEEKYSRRIASEIVRTRDLRPFKTTFDLVEVVEASIPRFAKATQGKHPATRTFQALRIAVNEELTSLETGLEKGFGVLRKKGRLAVISFHSLEDRIVKNFFRDRVKEKRAKLINRKPIVPSAKEVHENPRSRSAKLRIVLKLES